MISPMETRTHAMRDNSGSAQRQPIVPMNRTGSSNRASKERLPEISVLQKQQMFMTRIEKFIIQKIPKFDAANIKNIFEVSEFAEDIHSNMKLSENIAHP